MSSSAMTDGDREKEKTESAEYLDHWPDLYGILVQLAGHPVSSNQPERKGFPVVS